MCDGGGWRVAGGAGAHVLQHQTRWQEQRGKKNEKRALNTLLFTQRTGPSPPGSATKYPALNVRPCPPPPPPPSSCMSCRRTVGGPRRRSPSWRRRCRWRRSSSARVGKSRRRRATPAAFGKDGSSVARGRKELQSTIFTGRAEQLNERQGK